MSDDEDQEPSKIERVAGLDREGRAPRTTSGHQISSAYRMIAPWLRGYALTAGRIVRHRQHASRLGWAARLVLEGADMA